MIAKMLETLSFAGNKLVGLDTWNGFPQARSLLDMYKDQTFVYTNFDVISERLGACGITLVRGDIVETISSLTQQSLLLTFVDTDNYSPVKHALPLIAERTVVGGAIVFDHYYAIEDYNDALGECVAAAEFFCIHPEFINLSGTGVFIKMV